MTTPELVLTVVVAIALILIVTERLRADLGALALLVALALTHIVTPREAISGFSSSAVVTLLGLFVITAALDRTGGSQWIADRLARMGRASETRLVFLFTVGAALLSLFMNNIAAAAVLLPAAISVSRRTRIPASKLLMPLAFGTLLGGMATYFTTANILVSTALVERGLPGFGLLDFTPTGGLVALAGIAFITVAGRRLLPVRAPGDQFGAPEPPSIDLFSAYHLRERLWQGEVLPDSPLAGHSLGECGIGARLGVTVMAIWRENQTNLNPRPEDGIRAGDFLLIAGREDRVSQLAQEGVKLGPDQGGLNGPDGPRMHFSGPRVALVAVSIAPLSQVEGRSLKELNFRQKYGMSAVALWRDGRSYRTDVGNFQLRFGDSLLLVGPPDRIDVLRRESDFLVLVGGAPQNAPTRRALLAFGITVLALALAVTEIVAIPIAALLGAVLMVLTGCLPMDELYRTVEWKAIFLVAGMIPVGIAMTETGLSARLGDALVRTLSPAGPLALIGGLYVLTVLLGQVMGGQVVALVLAPIAISAASQANTNPQAAAIAVAIGCSTSFLTPVSHAVNVLVLGPGGYSFRDFFRVGWGLTLVCFVAVLVAVPLFWPLRTGMCYPAESLHTLSAAWLCSR